MINKTDSNEFLTIDDLIKNKEAILKKEEKKTATLSIKDLNGKIEIESIDYDFVQECIDEFPNELSKADSKIIYYAVTKPNLKDQNLQDAFKCTIPTEIVDKIFVKKQVRSRIVDEILKLSGVSGDIGVKKVEQIKN